MVGPVSGLDRVCENRFLPSGVSRLVEPVSLTSTKGDETRAGHNFKLGRRSRGEKVCPRVPSSRAALTARPRCGRTETRQPMGH